MFHTEMKRKFLKNPFHQANMFYNQEQDFYVCPMGQHIEHVAYKKTVSDLVDEAKRNSGGAFRQLIITLYSARNQPFWVGFFCVKRGSPHRQARIPILLPNGIRPEE